MWTFARPTVGSPRLSATSIKASALSHHLPDLCGTYLDNRYLLHRHVGSGHTNNVYKAQELSSSHTFAIKCMARHPEGSPEDVRQRMELDMHARVSVSCPGVVAKLHEIIRENCYVYVVMELSECRSLEEAIQQQSFRLNDGLIRTTFTALINTISQFHAQGLQHGNLSLDHILVSADGLRVTVLDLGLFAQATSCPESSRHSQLSNDQAHHVKDDLWQALVILATMVLGRNPWESVHDPEEHFAAFHSPVDIIRKVFPISDELNDLFKRVGDPLSSEAWTLDKLRDAVQAIPSFYNDTAEDFNWSSVLPFVLLSDEDEDDDESDMPLTHPTHPLADLDLAAEIAAELEDLVLDVEAAQIKRVKKAPLLMRCASKKVSKMHRRMSLVLGRS